MRRRSKASGHVGGKLEGDLPTPRFEHPKVIVIDTGAEALQALQEEGYNVVEGSFGAPYRVAKSSGYQAVVGSASLPNFGEQEVVIVDLGIRELLGGPLGEKAVPDEDPDWWAKCTHGFIDPRPRGMAASKGLADRILATGGVFVVFADAIVVQDLAYAQNSKYSGLSIKNEINVDNWSLLSVLGGLRVVNDEGEEILPPDGDSPIAPVLAAFLDEASFTCALEAHYPIADRWKALARNKYGAAVAGAIMPEKKTSQGWVLVFPQIRDKAQFLKSLLNEVLPQLAPELFPSAHGQQWVHDPEYELPAVIEKLREIGVVREEATARVSLLERSIAQERGANQFAYDLLRGTGTQLVEAVRLALELIGFRDVIDVDVETRLSGMGKTLREDLRIHDALPVLVVDVKGVAGHPADPDCLQAPKHAFIYMQEQKTADVRALTIINHQRLQAPLARENEMPFRKEILDAAEQMKLGLLTTFDLFRLVRGHSLNGWASEYMKPLLYGTGRIDPVPLHYQSIGVIKQVWKDAFSFALADGELRIGDRVAIEFAVDFSEQAISSLQIEGKDVQVVSVGTEVGVARAENLSRVKAGMRIFKLKMK